MSTLLAEAVAELGIEPGQTYTTTVGDCEVEVRRKAAFAPPPEEPSQFADMVMLNMFLNVPPSPLARTVEAVPGNLGPTEPIVIDESDWTPE